jgi:hypothetical protein
VEVEEITTIDRDQVPSGVPRARALCARCARGGERTVTRRRPRQGRGTRRSRLGWNFIGQLQSKEGQAGADLRPLGTFSLDRASVIEALGSSDGTTIECFVQLNLTDDPGRGSAGCRPERTTELVPGDSRTGTARRDGGALRWARPRPAFVRVREASVRMQRRARRSLHLNRNVGRLPRGHHREGRPHLRSWFPPVGEAANPG